jgi:hypothetical protein
MFQNSRTKTGFAKAGKLLPAFLCRFKFGGWLRRKRKFINKGNMSKITQSGLTRFQTKNVDFSHKLIN